MTVLLKAGTRKEKKLPKSVVVFFFSFFMGCYKCFQVCGVLICLNRRGELFLSYVKRVSRKYKRLLIFSSISEHGIWLG